MVNEDTWLEFIVITPGPMGFDIPMCGLCGGGGMIDTTKNPPIAPYGKPVNPIVKPCICPNGRVIKHGQPS